MKEIVNPIALRALENALRAARSGPKPRKKTDSRTADKFVIRGYAELFAEMSGIGLHHGRSANSEMVAAVLEALSGHERANATLRILKAHLGGEISERVLAEVPDFDLKKCKKPGKFIVRFPSQIREKVRDGVKRAASSGAGDRLSSMNKWFLEALVAWVNIQRQQYALLSAAIALEKDLVGYEGLKTGGIL